MPNVFVLDTSALLAHFLVETGHSDVHEILASPEKIALISAMSWLEFQVRLRTIVPDSLERDEVLAFYGELLSAIEPVTAEIANRAMALRESAAGRLPNADALIAATAVRRDAVLVHCDPHFDGIPSQDLRTFRLIRPLPN